MSLGRRYKNFKYICTQHRNTSIYKANTNSHRRAAAKRRYPTSEVRGSGREYQTAMAQERLKGATLRPRSGGRPRGDTQHQRSGAATRGVTPCLRSGAAAWRSYPMPLSPRLGAASGRSYPTPDARAVARRTNPTSKERWLHRCRRAERSYSMFNQGQEGWS